MKCSAPESAGIDREQSRDTAEHFPRSFISECEKQDIPRINPVFEQVGYAISKGTRLSRARAGNDKNGTGRRSNRCELLFVQFSGIIETDRRRRWRALQRVLTGHIACSVRNRGPPLCYH